MSLRAWRPVEIAGDAPVLLLAPHGGLRDHARTPWGSRTLKMNDVHTAAVTRALAAATGAAAVINDTLDRNVVDLNRVSAAADAAPAFLEAIHRALTAMAARHARPAVYVVHGWNVGEPIVDVGWGVRPGRHDDTAAIDDTYRTTALPRFCTAMSAAGIRVTLAARYPARGRENLVQLFTGRHADHPEPLVRALSAWSSRVDVLQLELGLPLRLPGRWRDRFVAAVAGVVRGDPASPAVATAPDDAAGIEAGLQFAGADASGLVRIGPGGGVLAIVLPEGGMLSFTGERVTPGEPGGVVGGLRLRRVPDGIVVSYRGPALRHPDTRAFEDLERSLTVAGIADVAFDLVCTLHDDGFGAARGELVLDGVRRRVVAGAMMTSAAPAPATFRVAVHLDATRTLLAAPDGGVLCDGGARAQVIALHADRSPHDVDALDLRLQLADGRFERLGLELVHRVPVVRNVPGPSGRSLHATCRVAGTATPTGWVEIADW